MIGDRECIDVSIGFMEELQIMRDFLADTSSYIIVDVETTGLNPKNDEILQVAICDGLGNELLNSYVMPERRRRWPNAQKINGITWDMVKDSPTLGELSGRIHSILSSKYLVVGYNLRFDFMMLEAGGVDTETIGYAWDIMNDCSVMMGNWNNARGEYAFVRLQAIASHYNIQYEPHDALEDARATAKVFRRLLNDHEYWKKVEQKEEQSKKAAERYGMIQQEIAQSKLQDAREQERRERESRSYRRITILAIFILLLSFAFASCITLCSSLQESRTYATARK